MYRNIQYICYKALAFNRENIYICISYVCVYVLIYKREVEEPRVSSYIFSTIFTPTKRVKNNNNWIYLISEEWCVSLLERNAWECLR